MCGKFTALASWRNVVDFSQPLTEDGSGSGGGDEGGPDEVYAYRVGGQLPVIIWDAEEAKRRVVPMRWGFPSPKDWRRPQPIHARSETIDRIQPFRIPFAGRQTGIVVFRTFNEGQEVLNSKNKPVTKQWTVDPKDGQPRGFAFLWNRFEIPDLPQPLLACVMATVPANELIRRTIKAEERDPRMPAILDNGYDVWATWLGENGALPEEARALLKTMEGITWEAYPEPPRPRKR
jgi:putative SOS response-associated peptidase YedK